MGIDRDRLGQSWWLHVWFHTCEMLNESSFAEWCSVLAEDERCQLKVGTWSWYLRAQPGQHQQSRTPWKVNCPYWVPVWVDDIDHTTGTLQFARKKACCGPRVLDLCEKRMALSACWWYAEGVASLLRDATIHNQTEFINQVMQNKVHYSIVSDRGDTPIYLGVRSKAWRSLSVFFSERGYKMSCGTFVHVATSVYDLYSILTTWNLGRKALSSPCQRDQTNTKGHTVFEKLRAGLLHLDDDDVDKNFVDPETKVTLLMEAAAAGNAPLVDKLCTAGVDVNAASSEGCTALHFAADFSGGEDGRKCMSRLLSAGANVHAGAGLSYKKHFMSVIVNGIQNSAAQICAHRNDAEGIDMLVHGGYDLRYRNTAMRDCLYFASYAADTQGLELLLERKASITEGNPKWNKKCPFNDATRYDMWASNSIHTMHNIRVLGSSCTNSNLKVPNFLIDYKCDIHHTGYVFCSSFTVRCKIAMHVYSAGVFKDGDTSLFETIVEKKAEVNYKIVGWPINFYFCRLVDPHCPTSEFASLLDLKVDFNRSNNLERITALEKMRKFGCIDKIEVYESWVKEQEELKGAS